MKVAKRSEKKDAPELSELASLTEEYSRALVEKLSQQVLLAKFMESAQQDEVGTLKVLWLSLRNIVPLGPITSDDDLQKMMAFSDSLIQNGALHKGHELHDLFLIVCNQIEAWEKEHVRFAKAEPREVLKSLMEEHGLRQSDLSDIVSQGVLSEILNGKRDISRKTAKALADRFGLGVQAFI